MLFPYFVYIVHFTKFTRGISLEKSLLVEKSFLVEKSLLVEKSKVEGKKKKKTRQKVPFCQEKKRKSFEKATGISGAQRWHPDFEQRSRRQTKNCYT